MYVCICNECRHPHQRGEFCRADEEDCVGHDAHPGLAAEEETHLQRHVQRLPSLANHGLHQPQGTTLPPDVCKCNAMHDGKLSSSSPRRIWKPPSSESVTRAAWSRSSTTASWAPPCWGWPCLESATTPSGNLTHPATLPPVPACLLLSRMHDGSRLWETMTMGTVAVLEKGVGFDKTVRCLRR